MVNKLFYQNMFIGLQAFNLRPVGGRLFCTQILDKDNVSLPGIFQIFQNILRLLSVEIVPRTIFQIMTS
jgi:hypothetical protein